MVMGIIVYCTATQPAPLLCMEPAGIEPATNYQWLRFKNAASMPSKY